MEAGLYVGDLQGLVPPKAIRFSQSKTILRLNDPTREEQQYWEKAVKQFASEIATLRQLADIPGIIQVHDHGMHQDLPWYAMDYIDAPHIIDGVRAKPLPEKVWILRRFSASTFPSPPSRRGAYGSQAAQYFAA